MCLVVCFLAWLQLSYSPHFSMLPKRCVLLLAPLSLKVLSPIHDSLLVLLILLLLPPKFAYVSRRPPTTVLLPFLQQNREIVPQLWKRGFLRWVRHRQRIESWLRLSNFSLGLYRSFAWSTVLWTLWRCGRRLFFGMQLGLPVGRSWRCGWVDMPIAPTP